ADHREMHALGADVRLLVDWFNTALTSLVALRTGQDRAGQPATTDTYYRAINDLDNRLMPRMEGIRDAVIRAHHAAGGSVGNLALAMDTARSTAQYRRDVLLASEPSSWERWATGTLTDSTSEGEGVS